MNPAIYNTIRAVVNEFGATEALARRLCDVIGDEIAAATQDALSAYRDEDPPPSRLGMTELEASLRWCPHVREVTPTGNLKVTAIGNRFLDHDGSSYSNPAACNCIGSYCMAWGWIDDLRGYCGLADRPTFQPMREPRRLLNRTPLERPTASEQVDLSDDEAAQ